MQFFCLASWAVQHDKVDNDLLLVSIYRVNEHEPSGLEYVVVG